MLFQLPTSEKGDHFKRHTKFKLSASFLGIVISLHNTILEYSTRSTKSFPSCPPWRTKISLSHSLQFYKSQFQYPSTGIQKSKNIDLIPAQEPFSRRSWHIQSYCYTWSNRIRMVRLLLDLCADRTMDFLINELLRNTFPGIPSQGPTPLL